MGFSGMGKERFQEFQTFWGVIFDLGQGARQSQTLPVQDGFRVDYWHAF
jgi:hypothetical protein